MMDEFDFTEDEIQEQLEQLGYYNVPHDRLREFKKDLEDLVKHERSRNSSWTTLESSGQSKDDEIYPYRPNNNHVNSHRDARRPQYTDIPIENEVNRYKEGNAATRLNVHLPQQSHGDPYIHINPAEIGNDYSLFSSEETKPKYIDTSLDTTTSTERKTIKRKVLRKIDGKSQVFDESSVTESDLDDLSNVEDRLRALPLSTQELQRPKTAPSGQRRRIAWGQEHPPIQSRPHTAQSDMPCYRLPDNYLGPKALIRPMTTHPNEKYVKKTDPVAKYQQYRQSWSSQRAPGEKNHKNLRWNVREQMLYHDEVVEKKPQKVFIPNSYKIPSDKKRKNLRWHIRTDLAQGVVPPSMFD